MQFHLSVDLDVKSRVEWLHLVAAYKSLKTKEKSSWVIPKVVMAVVVYGCGRL